MTSPADVLCRGALKTVFSDLLLGRLLVGTDLVCVGMANSSVKAADSFMMFERKL
jgi:hypothetical protein